MDDKGNTERDAGSPEKGIPPVDEATNGKVASNEPEWAASLKQLYNSVVEEPLPDNFKELLSKLDSGKN